MFGSHLIPRLRPSPIKKHISPRLLTHTAAISTACFLLLSGPTTAGPKARSQKLSPTQSRAEYEVKRIDELDALAQQGHLSIANTGQRILQVQNVEHMDLRETAWVFIEEQTEAIYAYTDTWEQVNSTSDRIVLIASPGGIYRDILIGTVEGKKVTRDLRTLMFVRTSDGRVIQEIANIQGEGESQTCDILVGGAWIRNTKSCSLKSDIPNSGFIGSFGGHK